MSTRETLLNQPKTHTATIPQTGTKVQIKILTLTEGREWGRQMKDENLPADASLIVACVHDMDGQPVFQKDDIPTLGDKLPLGIGNFLATECLTRNHLTSVAMSDQEAEAKEIKDAKN